MTWVRISLEFFRTTIVLSSQKKALAKHLQNWSIRILIRSSSCNILLFKREIIFLLKSKPLLFKETVGLLSCKDFLTQGKGIPVWFRHYKRILQDSGNLKRVAWGLDVGTGDGWTSIKTEFAFLSFLNFNLLHSIFALLIFKEVLIELLFT